ncbi:MAG: YqeG family HAD IIIA-type phosphatase [Clostridiales bacterium]|nr:YqeG family HAD IIIA-type phosphatase [Clostridiales bacterium]
MNVLAPDLYYSHVTAIDLADLAARGVSHLLIDLDNTLLPRDSSEISPQVREWLDALGRHGMSACLVSNNWHGHVSGVADGLGLPIVAKALKPFPAAFRRGLARIGGAPGTAAVIGDQIFTDVLGGNLLGMTTVLLAPLSHSDLPHTLALRRLERLVLAGRTPLA